VFLAGILGGKRGEELEEIERGVGGHSAHILTPLLISALAQ
jgi:hypothetical protein